MKINRRSYGNIRQVSAGGRPVPVVFLIALLVFTSFVAGGQIIDWQRHPPYLRVFMETDDFDATYLAVLEEAAAETQDNSIRLTLLNDLAYYWHSRNLVKAGRFAEAGLALAREQQDTLWEGRLQITQGAILLRAEKLDRAEAVLREAERKVRKEDLPHLHTQLGYVAERRGLLDKAAEEALIALRIGEETGSKHAIAMAYSDLANLFWKQSKFEKALEYGLQSIAVFEERGIRDMDYSFTLYLMGNFYLGKKNYTGALYYFGQAIDMSERYGFYNNLSDSYISLVDLYTETGDFAKAREASRHAIKYAELLDNAFLLMRSWLSLGKLQNLDGQPAAAVECLNTSLKIATEHFGDKYFLNQAYYELGKAYAGVGDYRSAYEAFQFYDRLKDSVFTAAADQRIAHLQTEFEVARKEATIASQEQALRQHRYVQLLTAGVSLLLLINLIGLYRSFVNQKKGNHLLTTLNDRLTAKNRELDKRNAENELLLQEIHHRVKNNLEIIASLLELQSAQIEDKNVQNVMQDSRNRVQSMSIIHQKLYQKKNLVDIEMKDYFINLAENVLDCFDAGRRVRVECKMEALNLNVDTAVPIGLIVNELLNNALKYAFPDGRKGKVTLALEQPDEQTLHLLVNDDGIGKERDASPEGTGFGTQLITLLTRQLNGTMTETVHNGTSVSFYFKTQTSAVGLED